MVTEPFLATTLVTPYPNSPCFLVSARWNDYHRHGYTGSFGGYVVRREVKVNPCKRIEWEERWRKDIYEKE